MTFDCHIGIDYSGAETPTSRLKSLQVYVATGSTPPSQTRPEPDHPRWNWTRKGIAEFLIATARSGTRFIAGIDHCFSFPHSYMERAWVVVLG